MDCAPALKMIAETATGYNNIDINYAKEKNIRVANVAGYSIGSSCTAYICIGTVSYREDELYQPC